MPDRHHLPSGLEVYSGTLFSVLKATVAQVVLAERASAAHLGSQLDDNAWYSVTAYLNLFFELEKVIGINTIFAMGKKIPEIAMWPPDITNIAEALASIDTAYHMNHRLNGRPMVDLATGTMLEGIGHYHFRLDGRRRAVMVCDNPYPSAFDHGIITGTARKFRPNAEVVYDEQQPSRRHLGESCTFIVTW